MATEEVVFACECGTTIKYSGLPDDFTRDEVKNLIGRHAARGHEPVPAADAAIIRKREKEWAKRGPVTFGPGGVVR
jgi:hypothetical protein